MLKVLLLISALFCLSESVAVTFPPGYYIGPAFSFKNYAGYVSVGKASHFYYWFSESQNNPSTDPLVVFLNGGPGCSSMGGFFTENGPFYVVPNTNGTKISYRDTSWNRVANMLWIESPAGVGFSYTDGVPANSTYSTNDHETAKLNLQFLLGWYQQYPQYASRTLYISGESYAGTYIPTFTVEILRWNAANPSRAIPLAGLLIGNPCSDEIFDHNAFFDLVSTHALIPQSLSQQIASSCPPTFRYIPDNTCCQFNFSAYPPQSSQCQSLLQDMYTLFANNNLYDIYAACEGGPSGFAPCTADNDVPAFLDRDDVRRAIGAAPFSTTGPWYDCTPNLNYTSNYASMVHEVYPVIFAMTQQKPLRIQIYSGDADACVPEHGTEAWTRYVGGQVQSAWTPWQSSDQQLAGYHVQYEKLAFVTLKGIGHMAPQFGPQVALDMFRNYLNNSPMLVSLPKKLQTFRGRHRKPIAK